MISIILFIDEKPLKPFNRRWWKKIGESITEKPLIFYKTGRKKQKDLIADRKNLLTNA